MTLRHSTILIILVLLAACGPKKHTNASLKTDLCKHWTLSEVELDGQKADASVLGEINTLEFTTNGRFEINENGQITKGRWSFNEETQTLQTQDRQGTIEHEILSLEEEKMTTRIIENNNEYKFYYTLTAEPKE